MWRAEAAAAFCTGRKRVGSSLMKVVPPAGLKNPDPIWATEPYWLWCWETMPPGRGALWFGESVLWLPVCWIQH